jgi:DNA-binding transcriptional LysR family regulator
MSASDDMIAFVRIADTGSFARAAADLHVTPSALSKLVSRLENRLGVRLMTRTTRRLSLTPEGELYLSRSREVLALLERTETEVMSARSVAKGHLRVNTGTGVALRMAQHVLADFLADHPEITIDLTVADNVIDPVAENVDVVLRTGEPSDSSLVARKLADLRRVVCAAPAYFQRHGTPAVPADLLSHNCLCLSSDDRFNSWPFMTPDGLNRLRVSGNFSSDNVGILLKMALNGHGIIRLADFVVGPALRDGTLVELLPEAHMSEKVPLWAMMPAGRHRAPRVQAFVNFMAKWLEPE